MTGFSQTLPGAGGSGSGVLDNHTATSGPTINDDSSAGYSVGSHWVDVAADLAYVLVDSSVGAAVWVEVTAGAAGGIANVVEDLTPQLGGDLDLNGNQLTSPDGTDLIDIPDGSIDLQTASTSRLDVTDSGVRLGAANARVTTVLDEDTMSSDSATALATQQSIKAYVDTTALLDSEVDADIKTLVLPANTTITAAAQTVLDDASTAAMLTTLGATEKATLTTKGDLYVATAVSTPARLGVGTNDQVLTADSAEATGMRWATAAGGGGGGPTMGAVGRYFKARSWPNNTYTTATTPLNAVIYVPFVVWHSLTLDRISVEVTTLGASNTYRLGIYNSGGGYPTTRITDYGTIDSSTTGDKELTISTALTAGTYFFACVSQAGTAAQLRRNSSPYFSPFTDFSSATLGTAASNTKYGWQETGVTGALPATATPAVYAATDYEPVITVRRSA